MRRGFRSLLLVLLGAMPVPAAALGSAGGLDVGSIAQALQRDPAQVVGRPSPTLSRADVRALRREIAKVDPGRIWVVVAPSLSQQGTSDLSNALSGYLNADGGGTVIVVAGTHVWGSTSWEDGAAATARLEAAFKNPRERLAAQLRQAVDSFASGDAAADHPRLNAAGAGSAPQPVNQPSGGGRRDDSSSTGLIPGLVVLALVSLAAALLGGKRVRRSMRASHRRKQERTDLQDQVQASFTKLGEEIEALDIDSSMPSASAPGKDEYANAIECYQEAERRLRTPGDDYQFERATDAVNRGRAHVHRAEQLFNPTEDALEAQKHKLLDH